MIFPLPWNWNFLSTSIYGDSNCKAAGKGLELCRIGALRHAMKQKSIVDAFPKWNSKTWKNVVNHIGLVVGDDKWYIFPGSTVFGCHHVWKFWKPRCGMVIPMLSCFQLSLSSRKDGVDCVFFLGARGTWTSFYRLDFKYLCHINTWKLEGLIGVEPAHCTNIIWLVLSNYLGRWFKTTIVFWFGWKAPPLDIIYIYIYSEWKRNGDILWTHRRALILQNKGSIEHIQQISVFRNGCFLFQILFVTVLRPSQMIGHGLLFFLKTSKVRKTNGSSFKSILELHPPWN